MKCQRSKFLLSRKTAYINGAYMSPLLKKAVNAGKKGILRKTQPNKIEAEDYFKEAETLKILFSQLINCPEPNQVAVIPSCSYGVAIAASNIPLKKGDKVVVIQDQFPSNYYAWSTKCQQAEAELVTVHAPDSYERRGEKWNEQILNTIDDKTKVVSMANTHWFDGTLFDLKRVRAKCDEVGAVLIIDGTQSIGAFPFDVTEVRPDALIVAGYKWLMGPYSIGLAYFGDYFKDGEPLEYSYINRKDSQYFANLTHYKDEFEPGSVRYDMGQKSNFILNPMQIAGLKQVLKWTPEAIQQYVTTLAQKPIEEIKSMGYYIEDDDLRVGHIFGIKVAPEELEAVQKALKAHRVSVSFRSQFVRVSPHVYNDEKDMRKLVSAFKSLQKS